MRGGKKIFFFVFLFLIGSFYLSTTVTFAASSTIGQGPKQTTLFVPIGDITESDTPPGEYINAIFKWGIGLAALLAMGQLVLGGVMYTLSAGSIVSQEGAKERMKSSVTGLILLIASVTILTTINPNLVGLKPIDATTRAKADIDKLTAGYASSTIATTNERNIITGPAYAAAAAAADARLSHYANFNNYSACVEAQTEGTKLKKEIDQYVYARSGAALNPIDFKTDKGDLNILEWLDDEGLRLVSKSSALGLSPAAYLVPLDTSDFREYLERAKDAKADGKLDEYHCWQDMLISSVRYAADHVDTKSLEAMVAVLNNLEDSFGIESKMYLTANPFGKKDKDFSEFEDEILAADPNGADTYILKLVKTTTARIDSKDNTQISEAGVDLYNTAQYIDYWDANLPYYKRITAYAKANLTPAQLTLFKKKFVDSPMTWMPVNVLNTLFP